MFAASNAGGPLGPSNPSPSNAGPFSSDPYDDNGVTPMSHENPSSQTSFPSMFASQPASQLASQPTTPMATSTFVPNPTMSWQSSNVGAAPWQALSNSTGAASTGSSATESSEWFSSKYVKQAVLIVVLFFALNSQITLSTLATLFPSFISSETGGVSLLLNAGIAAVVFVLVNRFLF